MSGYQTDYQAFSAVGSESTYGTDSFGGSHPSAFQAFVSVAPRAVCEVVEYDLQTPLPVGERHGLHKSHQELTCSLPLTGVASGPAAPFWAPLMRACGMQMTEDAGTYTFKPVLQNNATDTPSATLIHYLRSIEDTTVKKWINRGLRGNFDIVLEQGKPALMNFNMQGMYAEEPEAFSAAPTTPSALSGDLLGLIVQSLTVTLGAVTYKVSKMNVKSSWEIIKDVGGDPAGGEGSASVVLLQLPKSGARFGGAMTLGGGAAELADMLAKSTSGAVAELSATITDGTTTATLIGKAQIAAYTAARPRYDATFAFVRDAGEDGEDGAFSLIVS